MSFAAVLVVGLSMSYVISEKGHQANLTTQDLVYTQLPKLAVIKHLRSAINEYERLLYEYYTTTNRNIVWPKIQKSHNNIQRYLNSISESFKNDINALESLYAEVIHLSNSLDDNLSSDDINWDQARFDLANLTLTGQQFEYILVALTNTIQHEAWEGAESSQEKIEIIIYLVFAFSSIMFIAALYIGYYTQVNIRRTAKRRALAMFPQRNPNPVLNLNWQGHILFSNPACDKLLKKINVPGNDINMLLPHHFLDNLKGWQKEGCQQVNFEASIGGLNLDYSLSLLPDLESCHLYIEDVTERKKAQDQLTFQALHDVYTGLPNRRQLEARITQLISNRTAFSALYLSIDRFKFISSSQGYNIGDLIIRHLGQKLVKICEEQDSPIESFRLEGSTFCFIIHNHFTAYVLQISKHIQEAMDEPLCVREHRYYLNLSMGYCHYPEDGNDPQSLITNGNAALNHARKQGDSCEAYSPDLHALEQSWLPIEAGMRLALEKKQFILHYQAKVDAHSTQIKGAEALIRWREEDGNMISPRIFIPVAEQTGLIIKIGQWVIEEACRQAKEFSNNGQDIQLAINISARQFQHRHFLKQLKTAIEYSEVDPRNIELEITESLIMENAEHSISIMQQLKDMGFVLAIDDFGTGYSSLSYLKRFPIDTLKVDQAFVRNLETDEADQSIVRAIVDLAKHLGLKIVAEGVETQGQWRFLKDLGCDYIQGYYFSKPGHAENLVSDKTH